MPRVNLEVIATVGGATVPVTQASVSRAIGQLNGQATIVSPDASPAIGDAVTLDAGHNSSGRIFTGIVAGYTRTLAGVTTIDARDRLERMGMPWGGSARTYEPFGTVTHDDASIIRNFLEAYNIPSGDANIESSELGELAIVTPIRLEPGEAPWSKIREFDELASYTTFPKADGNIYRRPLTTGAGGDFAIGQGDNLIDGRRSVTRDGVINRCQVIGLEYIGTAVAGSATVSNSSIPDPPGFVSRDLRSNIIESDGQAGTVAANVVAAYGANRDRVECTIVGTSGIDLMDSVTVTSGRLGIFDGAVYRVTAISHEISQGGYTTVVRGEQFA